MDALIFWTKLTQLPVDEIVTFDFQKQVGYVEKKIVTIGSLKQEGNTVNCHA